MLRFKEGTTMAGLRFHPGSEDRILVVGGAGGIGMAIVTALKDVGAEAIVMDLPTSLAARSLPRGVAVRKVDVRREESVEAAFADLPPLTGAVNVFGYTPDLAPVAELAIDTFDDAMSANLRGVFLCCRKEAPLLSGGGALVNVSTGIAAIGAAGYAPYAAAKAGLNALTRVLAAELAPHVAVNAIAPGGVDTAFLRGGYGRGGREDGPPLRVSIEDYAKRTPMQRIGRPEDIAAPTLFLLSPAARYITGQVLHVNGGALMRD
jgi:3-oxoacyl-[acyl-carrier protein] reductase